MPRFSVIIPVYNRAESLICALDSVIMQTDRDYEIIVVDDGSDDLPSEALEIYGNRIRFIQQTNQGVSAARNRGISASRGEYILFLDSDDMWLPGKIAAHRKFIEANPRTLIHQTGEIWFRRGLRVNPKKKHRQQEGMIFRSSLELCLISPSACGVRRDLFDKYGLFDERMPACEDYDLWLRTTPFQACGLIEAPLSVRFGGHQDQLSSAYEAMDRLRLYSILKLLIEKSGSLKKDDIDAAEESGIARCGILMNGSKKRGRISEAENYSVIMENIISKGYSSRSVQIPEETICFLTGKQP